MNRMTLVAKRIMLEILQITLSVMIFLVLLIIFFGNHNLGNHLEMTVLVLLSLQIIIAICSRLISHASVREEKRDRGIIYVWFLALLHEDRDIHTIRKAVEERLSRI